MKNEKERNRGTWGKQRQAKKGIAFSLAAAMMMLSGCQTTPYAPQAKADYEAETSEHTNPAAKQENGDRKAMKTKDMQGAVVEQLTYSADDFESWNQILKENEISEEFQAGLDDFAYKSASSLLKDETGNSVYSPLSLYYALALAGYGAEGETASQILGELGAADREHLAENCKKLYRWYAYAEQRDKKTFEEYGDGNYDSRIRIANSLWVSGDLELDQQYQQTAAEDFFASSYGVDFKDAGTGERIGRWIAEHTEGVLTPQITMDSETMLALVNTLYFYGGWSEPFQKEFTEEDTFHLENGENVTVPFLNRMDSMGSFRKGDGYLMSAINTNNDCEMVFVLPDEDRTAAEFLENPVLLADVMSVDEQKSVRGEVVWKVPKFSFGSSFQLEQMLKGMGMEQMFEENAQFGGISSQPLMLSSAIQEAHIGIDENGVEGAAYTMLAMAGSSAPVNPQRAEMLLDRPFLFGIRDIKNNVWMFIGICKNPAESA